MLKEELLELEKLNNFMLKTYKFDQFLQKHGFQVFRLPSYHCDFNAIEYIWSDLKREIRDMNLKGCEHE